MLKYTPVSNAMVSRSKILAKFIVRVSLHLLHCVKSVRICSFSCPYSVRMQENTDQKISEYGYFSRRATYSLIPYLIPTWRLQ